MNKKSYNLSEKGRLQKIKNLGKYSIKGESPIKGKNRPLRGNQIMGLKKGWEITQNSEFHKEKATKFCQEHPEKHPNRIMAKRMKELGSHYCSKNQLELYYLVKSKYPEAELEYPIKTNHSIRFADIAIPSLKIDVEFDGERWHQNKLLDDLRTKHLNEMGWVVIRFTKDNLEFCLPKIEELKNGSL